MVEEIQKTTVGETDEHTDTWVVNPESIVFERLVNLGNYENVRFGGTFKVPQGMKGEAALDAIAAYIAKQIEVYRQKNDDYLSRKLTNVTEELERFQANLAKLQEDESLQLARLKAEITAIGKNLKLIRTHAHTLDNMTGDFFYIVNELLKSYGVTLEDLELSSYEVPNSFNVRCVESEITTPVEKDDNDEFEDEDEEEDDEEDEDEDWD